MFPEGKGEHIDRRKQWRSSSVGVYRHMCGKKEQEMRETEEKDMYREKRIFIELE